MDDKLLCNCNMFLKKSVAKDSLCVCGQDDGEQNEEKEQSWWLHDPRKWAMLVFL